MFCCAPLLIILAHTDTFLSTIIHIMTHMHVDGSKWKRTFNKETVKIIQISEHSVWTHTVHIRKQKTRAHETQQTINNFVQL